MIHKFLAAIFLLCSCFSFAQGDRKEKLTGVVVDGRSKQPLRNVTISLKDTVSGKVYVTTQTTSAGIFEVPVSDTGLLTLFVSHTGYKEQRITLAIGSRFNAWNRGTISLQPPPAALAEVVVTSSKPLMEQLADRLVYNAEKDVAAQDGTAADLLRNVPMVSVDGNGNVQLRGSSNIRVLINNRPSTLIAVSVADALKQLPANTIKSVEVITSPSAKYDAEGTAGIINIITKKNLLQGVTGSLTLIPGNVSTIGNAGLNYRRKNHGLNFSMAVNQFYNKGTTYLERRNYADDALFIQQGNTNNRSGFINPRLGFDYSFDEKNSINVGIAYGPSHNNVRNNQLVRNHIPGNSNKLTSLQLLNKTTNNGYDVNFDYLRTFKDPQKELSFLALYSILQADNISNQDQSGNLGQVDYLQRNLNKSRDVEMTFQSDYTQPLKKEMTLEAGVKAIFRTASSDVTYSDVYPLSGSELNAKNVFSYNQHVMAAYLLYGFKAWDKINMKIGSRYERTTIDADYFTRNYSFQNRYHNWIPSLNASVSIKNNHMLRAGYTQRLQRPQLFFLNPYREVITPQVIRQGNPELAAERAHLIEVGYGNYSPKMSVNASIYTRMTNNAITSSVQLENDTTYIHFLNIASNKTYGVSFSGTIKPVKIWSLNSNLNIYFSELNGLRTSNRGWMYGMFVSSNLDLGKGWWHGFNGSFNSRRVNLQGRVAAFYYHNTTIRKNIANKRGSIGINLANPFMKGTRVRNDFSTPTFEQTEDNINYTRGVRLSFSYRFGSLQQAKNPRKAKKSIENDDALRSQ